MGDAEGHGTCLRLDEISGSQDSESISIYSIFFISPTPHSHPHPPPPTPAFLSFSFSCGLEYALSLGYTLSSIISVLFISWGPLFKMCFAFYLVT